MLFHCDNAGPTIKCICIFRMQWCWFTRWIIRKVLIKGIIGGVEWGIVCTSFLSEAWYDHAEDRTNTHSITIQGVSFKIYLQF